MLFGVSKDWDWNNLDPSQSVLKDPETSKYLDIWACHGYGQDGATPTEGSGEATFWTNARKRVGPSDKPMWMTETSGYGNDINGTLRYAMALYAALHYGHVSGWVHWYGAESFLNGDTPTKQYYAAKQFYRFVRPGAVRIGSTVKGDSAVFATAFKHDADKSFTVVLINGANSSKTVKLVGAVPEKLRVYQTSEKDNCVDLGPVSKDEITLAPRSVTTLYDGPAIGGKAAPAKADPE
jgi:O-glycosyl hydrolase